MTYPQVSHTSPDERATSVASSPRFPAIEEAVLAYWEADDTFRASVEQRDAGADGSNEFVFYDGPPFANGLPHYGHLLTGYVKDLIPRYQTMRGRKVERRFGWDTHGLPAELEAMRLNGIKTTDEIVELGIEKFNEACRQSVLKYTGEWRDYVTRQARWVDFDNDYRTMNPEFMESVMWAFKQLHEKGLVYEGFRVLPYCWQDETPLSNHELRMDDDVYQMRQDPAVTVGYDVTTDGRLQGRQGPRLDDDAVDPPEQPRGDGRRGHRLRRRHLRRSHRQPRALPDRRGPPGVVRPRARGTSRPSPGAARAADLRRPGVRPAVQLLRRPRARLPAGARRVRHDHGRHRAGAHRRRLR